MSKSLKEKAIDIKGKSYVLVSDRVIYFNENFPNGSITTELLPTSTENRVEFKATVIPDVKTPNRVFTGHSQAVWGEGYINKTSAMENAETSAVGRALAMLGIGVIDSIASVDEIKKAEINKPVVKRLNYKDEVKKILSQEGGNDIVSALMKLEELTKIHWENFDHADQEYKLVYNELIKAVKPF